MDHNLEDSLTMESIDIDFDHSGAVVNQDDITLEDGSQVTHIPMDLDTIEGQSTLLEPNNEEVIVSDFIGDQFGFQDYSMEGENSSGANITIEGNQLREALTGTNEQTIDLQYADCVSTPTTSKSNVITIKAVAQQRVAKKVLTSTLTYPREIAIAPKPIKGPPKPIKGAPNVQYAIAPKPVALMVNKNANLTKTITMKNVVQNINKGNTVLAQVGKQLVMLPGGKAGQKIKLSNLLPTGSTDAGKQIQIVRCSPESAQLIANKGGKQIRTKFIVQGQSNIDSSNQPAVITKMVPVNTASQARYVMQQKTVPISIGGNKVVLTTPPKQGVKVAPKKQIISIKSQSPKVVTSLGNVQTKRVVITANQPQTQNVIVKAAGTKTSAQAAKDNTVQQQRTQLHPINVPGKGIQFIKLVTNQPKTASGGAVQKATLKPHTLTMSGKNFVLTDSLGKIIQMTAEKAISSQPPPLHLSSSTTSNTVTTRAPTKKLVRIAPVNKGITTTVPRAPQSLLIESKSPVLSGTSVSIEEFNEMVDQNNLVSFGTLSGEETIQQAIQEETLLEEETNQIELSTIDVKPTLASLISDAVSGEVDHEIQHMEEVEIEYDNTTHKQERYTEEENTNSMQHDDSSNEKPNENLIIVPAILPDNSSRLHNEHMYHDQTNTSMEDSRDISNTSMKTSSKDIMSYLTPQIDQSYPDSVYNMYEGNTDDPGLRPRKACNCTKSQCLKLYCDCFANGEFCNKCNCNNCHNNLENEELRQKAIRGCLERNPNAFRPKIGKAKSGGPEIIRRHNKGCNCKRSGCLKNYCECYEAKIACTMMCKCVGCRNVEETLERRREQPPDPAYRPPLPSGEITISRQPCSFMTPEVIEAVAQCMLATATEPGDETDRDRSRSDHTDPIEDILLEFSRCMADIINASHQQL